MKPKIFLLFIFCLSVSTASSANTIKAYPVVDEFGVNYIIREFQIHNIYMVLIYNPEEPTPIGQLHQFDHTGEVISAVANDGSTLNFNLTSNIFTESIEAQLLLMNDILVVGCGAT